MHLIPSLDRSSQLEKAGPVIPIFQREKLKPERLLDLPKVIQPTWNPNPDLLTIIIRGAFHGPHLGNTGKYTLRGTWGHGWAVDDNSAQ